MIRRIITIDQEKCNGCGLCVSACHEGAIGLKNGTAVLLRDEYCDGLGDCLPACPKDAISFEEREALSYDEAAVQEKMGAAGTAVAQGCPGSRPRAVHPLQAIEAAPPDERSSLTHWPVQIRLAPVKALYFDQADLLVAADCTAYAYSAFHARFMNGAVTVIGCPKLDGVDYAEKLGQIIRQNSVRSLHIVRMSVPCCGGLEAAVKRAAAAAGRDIPLTVSVISPQGAVQTEPSVV